MCVIEKNSIKEVFNTMSEDDIIKFIEDKYRQGYLKGKQDERRITEKVKFRYSVLLSWFNRELSNFMAIHDDNSFNTIGKIINVSNEYIFENNLFSGIGENIKDQVSFLFPIIIKVKNKRNE